MNKLFGKTATLVVGTLLAVGLASCASSTSMSAKAAKADGEPVQYKLTISPDDFNTTSYGANNNEKKTVAVGVADDSKLFQVAWTSNQMMKKENKTDGVVTSTQIQCQKNAAYIYNSTDLGTINSVTVTTTSTVVTVKYGSTEQPTESTEPGGGFFKLSVGNATTYLDKVEITFTTSATSIVKTEKALSVEDSFVRVRLGAEDIQPTVKADEDPVTGYALASSNTEVATIVDGKVHPVAEGMAKITVSKAEDEAHFYTDTSYNVVVEDTKTAGNLRFPGECEPEADTAHYVTEWTGSDGVHSYHVSNFNHNNFGGGWTYIKVGAKKAAAADAAVTTIGSISTDKFTQVINKVNVVIDAIPTTENTSINYAKLIVATDAEFANVVEEHAMTLVVGNNVVELDTAAANLYFKFEISVLNNTTSNGVVTLSGLVIYSTSEVTPVDPDDPTPTPTPTPTPAKKGCGGDIATISVILSAISLAGVGLLLLKKRVKE